VNLSLSQKIKIKDFFGGNRLLRLLFTKEATVIDKLVEIRNP